MELNEKNIKQLLTALSFSPREGISDIWEKKYTLHNKYRIQVSLSGDIRQWRINYGNEIKVGRGTTINFSRPENLVVLEVVNRLLEKGYKPESIELEKKWKVGGFLDVLVKSINNKAYLMIECKQWGREYYKAMKIILQNEYRKEQLFNYYLNEKSTTFLALYSSTINENSEITFRNEIIDTTPFGVCDNQAEIYEKWDKTFMTRGIFEDQISPYNIKFFGLTKKDLDNFDPSYIDASSKDTEGSIYNRFAEILRRHVISDKNNAYNKIFNLFLCKIVDEDNKQSSEEMDFQWKINETAIEVLTKLNDLYKKGMQDYLKLDVADVTEDEFDNELAKILRGNADDTRIREMFQLLRLYKNNEFAFKEVIDERTFNENSEIVREVVRLLEPYRIKYSHKQQFLGEFFERLLNIGVKQESGQFFTPIPIASFICKSIDFEKIIDIKINERDPNFLPYIIDYACGSGHFLTEAMERVDRILQDVPKTMLKSQPQKDNSIGWKVAFKWATEFVYGIERDYRLAKTTKVASFLNGDGDANIIYGDGLSNFNSPLFIGKLQSASQSKDNQVFDTVVANPPYAVENFKLVLQDGEKSFDLFKAISDKSDDIECLFIERTKQLLKDGGVAGIIVPSAILLNTGIQQKAREIILKYFEIKGIVELSKITFAASGLPTVILFLKRRNDSYFEKVKKMIGRFLTTNSDFAFEGNENIISNYLKEVYPTITLSEFISSLSDSVFAKAEGKKLFFYLLTFNQTVVIVHPGNSSDEEKRFLGYEHSDMRKYEGIHPFPHNPEQKIKSMLYDDEVLDNPEKVSTYILKNFREEKLPEVSEALRHNLEIKKLWEIMDFPSDEFKFAMYVKGLNNQYLSVTKFPLVTLGDNGICEILDFRRRPIKKSKRKGGIYPYYGATRQVGWMDEYIFDEKLVLIGEDGAKWKKGEKTAYVIEGKSWVNNHAHVIKPTTKRLGHEFLKEIFCGLDFSYLKSRPNGGKLLKSDLTSIKFPLPKPDVQEKIIEAINSVPKSEKYDKFDELLGVKTPVT